VLPWIILCLAACAALLGAEYAGSRVGIWISKPLAAAAYIGAALAAGAPATLYGRFLLLGLSLSWLGDLLLIPQKRASPFLAGLVSFLLAHVAFAVAFSLHGISLGALVVSACLAGAGGVAILRWLWPHLDGVFRWAVPTYTVVIAAMVTLGGSAAAATGSLAIAVGAWLFAISDVSVASNRLVEPSFRTAAWGLPMYFTAQLVLASTAQLP
jgi:uncharacterized membrane protein YhhN